MARSRDCHCAVAAVIISISHASLHTFPCNPVVLFAPRRIIHIPAGPSSSRPACAPRSDRDPGARRSEMSKNQGDVLLQSHQKCFLLFFPKVRCQVSSVSFLQNQTEAMREFKYFSVVFFLEFVKTKLTLNFFSDWHVNAAAAHPPLSSRFAAIIGQLGSFLLHQ